MYHECQCTEAKQSYCSSLNTQEAVFTYLSVCVCVWCVYGMVWYVCAFGVGILAWSIMHGLKSHIYHTFQAESISKSSKQPGN